jgi:hypothetical protein
MASKNPKTIQSEANPSPRPATKPVAKKAGGQRVSTAKDKNSVLQNPGLGIEEMSAVLEAVKTANDPVLNAGLQKPSASTQAPLKNASIAGSQSKATSQKSKSSEAPQSAAVTPKSSAIPLRIFQIYYEPWQRELLDPNFIALDNGKTTTELMEFAVFERLLKSEHVKDVQLWGALSWRFTERTGMTGAQLVQAIAAQPGKDIYFCDPVPVNEALFHNFWLQGETSHPQFLALCQAIFKVTGLPESELTGLQSSVLFSASNYYIGTPRFWMTYIPWINQVLSAANKKLPPKIRDLMHSKLADDRDLHKGCTYVPFIVERLLPVFLKTAGKDLLAHKIALPLRESELNVHLKLLREMKDVAHRTKSTWLAACWVNYRNLYLMQANGKEWCDKHLRTITPTEIHFS